jgi:hypothetical protein
MPLLPRPTRGTVVTPIAPLCRHGQPIPEGGLLTGAGEEERKVTTHRRAARERKRRQTLIAEHVRQYGWVCPGFERPPHPSHDLTCDHLVAQARGAAPESEIRVLCRSCNGRRGARPQLQAPSLRLQPRPRFSRRTLIGVVPEGAGGLSKRRTPSHPSLALREKHSARSRSERDETSGEWVFV